LGAAIGALEVQRAGGLAGNWTGRIDVVQDGIPARCLTCPRPGLRGPAAVTAEVDDRRLELAQLAEQIERLHGPSGLELEAVPVAGALQLVLDRPRLPIEREPVGTDRIGSQKQDLVLLHGW